MKYHTYMHNYFVEKTAQFDDLYKGKPLGLNRISTFTALYLLV